jgi:hypothetical protein
MQKLWKHPECETARIACYQSETHDKKLLKKTTKNIVGQSDVIKVKLIITKTFKKPPKKNIERHVWSHFLPCEVQSHWRSF